MDSNRHRAEIAGSEKQSNGRRATSAAAGLIALVFLGFATGSLLLVQQLGFAPVVAVLIDATLVRCVLLPAVVALVARRSAPGRSKVGPDVAGPGKTFSLWGLEPVSDDASVQSEGGIDRTPGRSQLTRVSGHGCLIATTCR
jgi:hypothetical protein